MARRDRSVTELRPYLSQGDWARLLAWTVGRNTLYVEDSSAASPRALFHTLRMDVAGLIASTGRSGAAAVEEREELSEALPDRWVDPQEWWMSKV